MCEYVCDACDVSVWCALRRGPGRGAVFLLRDGEAASGGGTERGRSDSDHVLKADLNRFAPRSGWVRGERGRHWRLDAASARTTDGGAVSRAEQTDVLGKQVWDRKSVRFRTCSSGGSLGKA